MNIKILVALDHRSIIGPIGLPSEDSAQRRNGTFYTTHMKSFHWRLHTTNRFSQLRSHIFAIWKVCMRARKWKRKRLRERGEEKLCYEKFNMLEINWRWTSHTKKRNGGYGAVFWSSSLKKPCKCVYFLRDTHTHQIEFLACVSKMRWLTDVTVVITTCLTNRLYWILMFIHLFRLFARLFLVRSSVVLFFVSLDFSFNCYFVILKSSTHIRIFLK